MLGWEVSITGAEGTRVGGAGRDAAIAQEHRVTSADHSHARVLGPSAWIDTLAGRVKKKKINK